MIRLKPASSNTKRRQNANSKTATRPSNKGTATDNKDSNPAKQNGGGTSKKVNALYEELLGDNASAIGSVANTAKGEESTAMSSVLGPILRGVNSNNDIPNNKDARGNMDHIPEERQASAKATREYSAKNNTSTLNINSNNNPTLKNMKQQQQHHNPNYEDEIEDEDTYMTKPREIMFDSNDDDVSALFGNQMGGASVVGKESYMGTFARNRQRRGGGGGGNDDHHGGRDDNNNNDRGGKHRSGGGGMFGGKKNKFLANRRDEPEEESRGVSTLRSAGVNSILEEIGLRPSKKNLKGSFSGSDIEEEGHKGKHGGRRGDSRHNERSGKRRGHHSHRDHHDDHHHNYKDHYDHPQTLFERIKSLKPKTWAIILVGVLFVTIQFSTIRRRDRATMEHLNWRFTNHRYPSSSGLSAGTLGAIDNMEGGRRRGASFNTNSLDGDGLGDVLRKSVPLMNQQQQLQQNMERAGFGQDQLFFDDGLPGVGGGGGNNNLRGGGGGGNSANMHQPLVAEPKPIAKQQQQVQKPLPLPQQELKKPMNIEQNNNVAENQEVGDTHPLLKPKDGLSMAAALDKLNSGNDKLSAIDPRPMQALSNDIVPSRFSVFADLKTPYIPGRDTPFFWHIPRSGGVVVKTMLSHCLGQTLAAEVGELNGHDNDSELKVVNFADHNYTNVNIATPEGITRALNLGLVPSHLSHTLVSAHVDLIPSLFNANDRARAFVLFRHPIDRAASMFYFLKGTGYPPLKDMTIDDYAKSELIENNWLVRILSESMTGPIDMDNLEVAKEVLRRKFIVGMLDNKRGSFARFDHYFKWKDSPHYEQEFGCRKQLMDEKYVSKHPIRRDSNTWKLLLEQNRFDVHLYDFAKELFSHQSYIFGL